MEKETKKNNKGSKISHPFNVPGIVCLILLPLLWSKIIFALVHPVSDQHRKDRSMKNPVDGTVMVWITGGEFLMGRRPDGENPGYAVSIEGFWMGKFEITNEQYALFIAANDYPEPDFWDDPRYNQSKCPVIGITWEDAIEYCHWAGVRLPTEAEWEYTATAGGKQYRYGTRNGDLNHNLANYSGVYGDDRWEFTSPVGSFSPNPFGLYDMAGNAWEWCSSIMLPNPYSTEKSENLELGKGFRVMRGGCWFFGSDYCHVSDRHYHRQDLRFDFAGFRVALSDDK